MKKYVTSISGKSGLASKALAFALGLAMLLTLAACGDKTPKVDKNPFAEVYAWASPEDSTTLLMFHSDFTWTAYDVEDDYVYEEGAYSIDEGKVTLMGEDSDEKLWGYVDEDGDLYLTDDDIEQYFSPVDASYTGGEEDDNDDDYYNVFAEVDRWAYDDEGTSQKIVFYFDMTWEVYDDYNDMAEGTYVMTGNGEANLFDEEDDYIGTASVTEGGVLVLDNGSYTENYLPVTD